MRILPPKSIAEQVDEILLERIRSGKYPAGSRIPSESDLSDELGASRATIRTVLARLAANGFIIRKQGDGTYVNERIHQASANFGNLWDLTEIIAGNGYHPSIQLISTAFRAASEKEALVLGLESGAEIVCLKRLLFAGSQPVIYADNVIPASMLAEPLTGMDGSLHLREILNIYFHQKIAFVLTDIRSVMLDHEVWTHLGGEEQRSLLQLQTIFFEKNNLPIALGVNIFDDSFLHLSLAQAWS